MKKITLFIFVTLFSLASINTYAKSADSALELYFFGSATCGECIDIKNNLLNPLTQEHGSRIRIRNYDSDKREDYELMLRMERQYGVKEPASQTLFFPDTVLLGYSDIMENTRALVSEYFNNPHRLVSIAVTETTVDLEDELRKRVNISKFWLIAAAAFVDSINPCAIATMVFLVSFLATRKRKRSEILIVGMSFTAAVFITYLLLGAGVFAMLTAMNSYYIASRVIKWIAITLAGGVGIISLIDAFRFKKTKDAKSVTLQLPKSVKMRIHNIITTNMKGSRLVIGAIITGFTVTLLEAVCTGQVYLPAIAMMVQSEGSLKLIGWLYLVMYNFIFVIPLIAVMIATYYGMRWDKLSKMAVKHLTLSKILLGCVMIGLAAYMFFAL